MGLNNEESGKAIIKDGWIVIGVPIKNLASILEGSWASGGADVRYRLVHAEDFAEDIVRELNRESENGTTHIHQMFDGAMYEAIEQGAEGVVEHEDQEP